VTLRPDSRHKNAVAIVEVEVQKGTDIGDGEKPAITALLPREKTYNVASITESNASIGGGMVTQVIGFGGSFLRSRRTYYVVLSPDLTNSRPSRPSGSCLSEPTGASTIIARGLSRRSCPAR
jgi:hypothetical protein